MEENKITELKEEKNSKKRIPSYIYLLIGIILVVAIGIICFLGFAPKDNSNKTNENTEVNNNANQTEKSPYEKYPNLRWEFKDGENYRSSFEFAEKRIEIEDGIVYLYADDSKQKIESIEGKAIGIALWGQASLERVYILTENGELWLSLIGDASPKPNAPYELHTEFEKVNIKGKVIDMTNGYGDEIRAYNPPYFLLSDGTLINERGSLYEDLEGNFVDKIGFTYYNLYVGEDQTLYQYDSDSKKYIQITAENNKSVKLRDYFMQDNNVTGHPSNPRLSIITEDGQLLYYEFEGTIAKEYEETAGKKVKSLVKEKNKVKIAFTDNTEKIFTDTKEGI